MTTIVPVTEPSSTETTTGGDVGIKPTKAIIRNTSGRYRNVVFDDEITFDDGRAVLLVREIEKGEFSSVFIARDSRSPGKSPTLYALKQVHFVDDNTKDAIEREVAVHGLSQPDNNIMPLLGFKYSEESCFLLFPYIQQSLRDDIGARRLLQDTLETKRKPYSEREALTLFYGVARAIRALHDAGFSHRDIKVENVLLKKAKGRKRRGRDIGTPVLTDFGSAGPLTVKLRSYADILQITEDADRHSTLSYCAPELRGGTLEYGASKVLHYGYADVWSLGCLLFAMLYGSSPFEMEWGVSLVEGAAAEGTARIVECTFSKVMGPVPFPPAGSAAERRYGESVKDLIRWMLRKKGRERPNIAELEEAVEEYLKK